MAPRGRYRAARLGVLAALGALSAFGPLSMDMYLPQEPEGDQHADVRRQRAGHRQDRECHQSG